MNIVLAVFVFVMFLINTFVSILNYRNKNEKLPKSVKNIYEKKDYQEWHKYFMTTFKFDMIKKTISTVIILTLLITNSFMAIQDIASNFTNNDVFQSLIFVGVLLIGSMIIDIPFKYFEIFVIEEKFGFNKTNRKLFFIDLLKNLMITVLVFGSAIVGIVKLVGLFSNQLIYLVLALWLFSSLFIVLVNLFVKFFIKMLNKLSPLEEGSLKDRINILSDKTGFNVKSIWIMDASKRSTKLNAMFMGFGKKRDIVLFDTLVEKLSEEEIVSVLAHELGHAVHKDVVRGLFETIAKLGLYALILGLFLLNASLGVGYTLIALSIVLKPLSMLIGILTSRLSRDAEFKADAFSTDYVDKKHMISALKVLAKENFANLTPHPLYVWMHYSHPTISQRIEAINNL